MKKLLLSSLLIISTNTFALDVFLEPFVGYQFSNQRTTVSARKMTVADETSFETSGLALGAKMGYFIFPYASLGLDLKYSLTTGEGQGKNRTETEMKRKLTEKSAFATATYFDGIFKYSIGIGIYGQYTDSGDYNKDGKSSMKVGSSYKMGFGYYFSQNFSANIDLELIKTKTEEENDKSIYTMDYDLEDGTMANALISIGYRFY